MILTQQKQIRMKDGDKLGKKDSVTKEYMRDPIVFADAFNKYLYHGRQVIKPECLKELDAAEIAVPYGSCDAAVPEQRYRDVLKTVMTDGNMAYCILGIENQSDIHYAIPVKVCMILCSSHTKRRKRQDHISVKKKRIPV